MGWLRRKGEGEWDLRVTERVMIVAATIGVMVGGGAGLVLVGWLMVGRW